MTTADFQKEFTSPISVRPKIRWWWPSANRSEAAITEELSGAKKNGFDGVEIIYMSSGTAGTDLQKYGWATEAWNKKTEYAMAEGERLGMRVDLTIGPCWPAAIPSITPESVESCKILVYGVRELRPGDLDADGRFSGRLPEPGGPVSAHREINAGTGLQVDVMSTYQAPVAGLIIRKTGNVRTDNERALEVAVANWIELAIPVTELDPSTAAVIEDGRGWALPKGDSAENWLVFSFAMRSNGHSVAGSTACPCTVIDHYSAAATRLLTGYWDEHLLTEAVCAHLEKHGGNMFEDSLELRPNQVPWTPLMVSEFISRKGYDPRPFLPVLFDRYLTLPHGGEFPPLQRFGFPEGAETRFINDFTDVANSLYLEGHLAVLASWSRERHLDFRAQAYSGYDTHMHNSTDAAALVPVIEGESLAFMEGRDGYDSWRVLTGGAHMAGKQLISDELGALIFTPYMMSFRLLLELCNKNSAGGANQFIVHGLTGDYCGEETKWPGWNPFDPVFGEPWDKRQPVYGDMSPMTDYMARCQLVLQQGKAATDLAVYRAVNAVKPDTVDGFALTDAGYCYDFLSPGVMELPQARVANAVLAPEGAAYRALILNREDSIPLKTAETIQKWALDGLPVIFIGTPPQSVSGFLKGEYADSDARLRGIISDILRLPRTAVAKSEAELPALLAGWGILPAARYDRDARVITLHRRDGEADYYWMYNAADTAQSTDVLFEGQGTVYRLGLWDGSVREQGPAGRPLRFELLPGCTAAYAVCRSYRGALQPLPEARQSLSGLTGLRWTLSGTAYEKGALTNSTVLSPLPAYEGPLCSWDSIPGWAKKCGRACYTLEFTPCFDSCPAWLRLTLGDGVMGVLSVMLNGRELAGFDQTSGYIYLGCALQAGVNRLEIKTATTLCCAARDDAWQENGILRAEIFGC